MAAWAGLAGVAVCGRRRTIAIVAEWWSIEVLHGEVSAFRWQEQHDSALIEAALTNGVRDGAWHADRWGVVFEVLFDTEEQWEAFRGLPVVRAALDAVPDPVNGLLIYRGRGGGAGAREPRRPEPAPSSEAVSLPGPADEPYLDLAAVSAPAAADARPTTAGALPARRLLMEGGQRVRRDVSGTVPGSRGLSERSDGLRGGFAAADGALHVAVPLGGTLSAGPVDASGGCAPRLAVGRPDSRCEVRAVAAAGELLGHPVPLDVLLGARRRLSEVPDEAADHGIAPLGLAAARLDARFLALKEAHQDAGRAGWR